MMSLPLSVTLRTIWRCSFSLLLVSFVSLWLVTGRAIADPLASGQSENDDVLLTWDYSLDSGEGTFTFQTKPRVPESEILWLDELRFDTAGLDFDTIETSGVEYGPYNIYVLSRIVGVEGVRAIVQHEVFKWGWDSFTASAGLTFHVTFPTDGVQLRAEQFEYDGYTASGSHGVPSPLSGEVDFVSIQTIPEPASVAGLALGAAGLLGLRRRD